LDQDDLWEEGKLLNQVEALARFPSAGLCHCDLRVLRSEDDDQARQSVALSEPTFEVALDPDTTTSQSSPLLASLSYFSQRFVVPSTVLVKRHCLARTGLLDPFMSFSGDYDLLIRLGSEHAVVHVSSVDVLYRKHDHNFSDQYAVGRAELRSLISGYVGVARMRRDRALAKRAPRLLRRPRRLYAAQAYDCARRSVSSRDYSTAARHLSMAVWFDPAFVARSLLQYARSVAS
jgi:hypothetical protein